MRYLKRVLCFLTGGHFPRPGTKAWQTLEEINAILYQIGAEPLPPRCMHCGKDMI